LVFPFLQITGAAGYINPMQCGWVFYTEGTQFYGQLPEVKPILLNRAKQIYIFKCSTITLIQQQNV